MAKLAERTLRTATVVLLALLGGSLDASEPRGAAEVWLPNRQRPGLIRLDDGRCMDLRNLPPDWKTSSRTGPRRLEVGLPGKLGGRVTPHYKLLVITGNNYASPTDWDFYVRNFEADESTRKSYQATWDIPGFSALPGYHREIIWIGDKIDAVMECRAVGRLGFGPASCVLHEGKQPGATYLDIRFGFDERSSLFNLSSAHSKCCRA